MKAHQNVILTSLALVLLQAPTWAAPGDVDLSFDPGSSVNGPVNALALQSDGRVIIGGAFTTVHGAFRTALARLYPDGILDGSFLPNLGKADGDITAVRLAVIQPDEKILIAGSFSSVDGVSRTNLARLNADGTLDSSFLNGLVGPNAGTRITSLLLQNDGKILISGNSAMSMASTGRTWPD